MVLQSSRSFSKTPKHYQIALVYNKRKKFSKENARYSQLKKLLFPKHSITALNYWCKKTSN